MHYSDKRLQASLLRRYSPQIHTVLLVVVPANRRVLISSKQRYLGGATGQPLLHKGALTGSPLFDPSLAQRPSSLFNTHHCSIMSNTIFTDLDCEGELVAVKAQSSDPRVKGVILEEGVSLPPSVLKVIEVSHCPHPDSPSPISYSASSGSRSLLLP